MLDLLKRIQEVQFGVIETTLFLNTHPGSREALRYHNELARQLHELQHEYAEKFGPLMITSDKFEYPWNWIDKPWPWQINYQY